MNDMQLKRLSTTKLHHILAFLLPQRKKSGRNQSSTPRVEKCKHSDDPELLWLLAFNNINDAKEMAESLIRSVEIDNTELTEYMNQCEWIQVAQVAHRIKGTMAILGLIELVNDAQVLQTMAENKVEEQTRILSKMLQFELDRLSTKVQHWRYNFC